MTHLSSKFAECFFKILVLTRQCSLVDNITVYSGTIKLSNIHQFLKQNLDVDQSMKC